MFRLLRALLLLPPKAMGTGIKAAGATTAGSFRLGYKTGKLVGYRRIVLVVVGAVAALFFTPVTGPELRERAGRLIAGRTGAGRASRVPPSGHAPAPATVATNGATNGAGDVQSAAPAPEEVALEDPSTAPDGPLE